MHLQNLDIMWFKNNFIKTPLSRNTGNISLYLLSGCWLLNELYMYQYVIILFDKTSLIMGSEFWSWKYNIYMDCEPFFVLSWTNFRVFWTQDS